MLKNYFSMLKREFAGYNAAKLASDLLAGLTVAAVALPLALAFGVSSGADAAAGLITAIIAGLVISALSGASFQISGPTGAMSAILIGIVATHGLNAVFFVSFIAGVILLVCGIFRLGKLVALIPRPVITGFTSGIALIIALGQIDNFFGTVSEGTSAVAKLGSYFTLGFKPHLTTLLLGLIVVAVMLIWPKKWNAKVPSSLVGIIVSTIVYVIFRFEGVATVGEIPRTLFPEARFSLANIDFSAIGSLLPSAITVAALGMIESLLCGASASRMKNEPFNADIELIAQGVGNILIPFFGGVPATAAIARTSVAIKSGAKTRLTGIFHAVWLLVVMFALGGVMKLIPLSALGGVLIVTAWRMNEWDAIKYMFGKKFAGAIVQFFVTMIATVLFDLTIAIVIGIVVSLVIFVKNAAHIDVTVSELNEEKIPGRENHEAIAAYVNGTIFFANANALAHALEAMPERGEVILSFEGVSNIDITGIETLTEYIEDKKAHGVHVLVCGMNGSLTHAFDKSGLTEKLGAENIYSSMDAALGVADMAAAK